MARLAIRNIPYAVFYDRTPASIDFNNVYDKERTDSFSFSFWLFPTDNASNSVLFQKRDEANEGYTIQFGILDDAVRFTLEGVTGNQQLNVDSDTVFTLNKWHYVTVTYDGSSNASGVTFYKNGQPLSSPTVNVDDLASNITNTTDFKFGARDGGGLPFLGSLTDWRIHNAELTATQVLTSYEDNVHASVQDHVAFSEGTGSTITSDNALTGTATAIQWVKGPMQKRLATRSTPYSLQYDAASAVVDLADDVYNADTEGAFEAWVYLPPDDASNSIILGVADSADANELFDIIIENTGDQWAVRWFSLFGGTTTNLRTPLDSVRPGVWNHIVVSSDGSAITMFVNGSVQPITVTSGSNAGSWFGDATFTTAKYSFGVLRRQSGDVGWFTGSLATTRYYSTGLTAAEVEELYYDDKVPTAKLTDEWLHTEGTGSTLTSTGTGGNDGTITGATWANGPMQKRLATRSTPYAGEFDGSASLVDFGNNYDKDGSSAFGFSFWFKTRNLVDSQSVFEKRDLGDEGYEILFGVTDGTFRFNIENTVGGQTSVDTDAPLQANRWYFVTIVYDGTNDGSGTKFYINGLLVASSVIIATFTGSSTNATDFRIGARDDASLPFNGLVTDFRIHNAELTAAEVSDAYFNNVHSSVQDYIPFSEGAGTTVTSTGAVAGTATSLTWNPNNTPF